MTNYIDWDEAVKHVMKVTGKNRRQAQAALMEKCRQGEIEAIGENTETGRIELIPKEAWPKID